MPMPTWPLSSKWKKTDFREIGGGRSEVRTRKTSDLRFPTLTDLTMTRTCPNCHYPLPRFGKFCSHCGQKYTDGRIRLSALLQDFFHNVLNLDNKLWQTFRALLIPGRLTRHYFEGKHRRYVSPLRLFFTLALIVLFVVGFSSGTELHGFFDNLKREQNRDIYHATFLEEVQEASARLDSVYASQPVVADALDSLYQQLHQNDADSTHLGIDLSLLNRKFQQIKVAKVDLANMAPDSLLTHYGQTDFWDRLLYQQYIKLTQEGDNFTSFVLGKMVWMILLMMPALALILKLLYIRRRRYFVEHLVFLLHTHSFSFLLGILILLVSIYADSAAWSDTALGLAVLWLFLYPLIALRRFYRQAWWKTFVKYSIFNFLYFFLFLTFLSFTFVATALTY